MALHKQEETDMKIKMHNRLSGKTTEIVLDEQDWITRDIGFFPDPIAEKLVSKIPSAIYSVESTDEAWDSRELGASMEHVKVSDLDIDVDGVPSETQSPWLDFVMNTDLGETRPLLTEAMKEEGKRIMENLHQEGRIVRFDLETQVDNQEIREIMQKLNKLAEDKKIVIFRPGSFAIGGTSLYSMIDDSWQKEAMVETVRPPHIRHWDEPKLRRGKGHNKLKRKGKK